MKSGITAELPVVWADQNHIICQEAQINYQTCKKNMHTHTHTHTIKQKQVRFTAILVILSINYTAKK